MRKRDLALSLPVPRVLIALSVLTALLLSGCQSGSAGGPTPDPSLARPDLVGLIDWDRSPSTVIFRAEVVGSTGAADEDLLLRNEVPLCSVYGDNRVVWTTASGEREDAAVVWDRVSDEDIRLFIEELSITYGLYGYGAASGTPTPEPDPEEGDSAPVVERLTLFINDNVHQTTARDGWPVDLFPNVLERCRVISRTPIRYEPPGVWLTVRALETSDLTGVTWSQTASGLDLAAYAGGSERQWVSGDNAYYLWEIVRTFGRDVVLQQRDQAFQVAVEAPGVTTLSPPAP